MLSAIRTTRTQASRKNISQFFLLTMAPFGMKTYNP